MTMRVALLAGLALAAAPVAAAAHPELVATRPADGDTLRASPATIRLLFDEPVEPALTIVRLLGAGGELVLVLRVDPADPNAILAAVPGALDPGPYQVAWQVTAADGHRIQGGFLFVVQVVAAPDTGGPPPEPNRPEEPTPGPSEEPAPPVEPASSGPASWPLGLLRGAAIACLLAFAGTLALASRSGNPNSRRLVLGLGAAATLLLAAHALAWAGYASPRGLDAAGLRALLAALPGQLEALRLLFATAALVALAAFRRNGAAAVLALGAVAVTGAMGHAATHAPWWNVPTKALHLLALAAWLGGLLHLASGALRGDTPLAEARRVSSLALACIIVVALTGAIQALLNLAAPADLVRSPYGMLVLVKTAGLLALAAFGARHRFRIMPGMTTGTALERSVRWEIVVMALVTLAAGLLAYTPPPSG